MEYTVKQTMNRKIFFTIDWNDTNSAIAEMPEGVPLSPRHMIKKLKKIDDDGTHCLSRYGSWHWRPGAAGP